MQKSIDYYLDQIINSALAIKEISLQVKKNQRLFRIVDDDDEAKTAKSLKFTKKELEDMPKLKDGKIRRHGGSWEIRYRREGLEKSFSGKTKQIAIDKFKLFIKNTPSTAQKHSQTTLATWATKAFELKSELIKQISFEKDYLGIYKNHIAERFGDMEIKKIKPFDIQKLINELNEHDKTRVIEKVRTVLNYIFETALANGEIERNPMPNVTFPKHYRTTGQALSIEDEIKFLKRIETHRFKLQYLFMLYSGSRLCEVVKIKAENIDLENNQIKIECAKVKQNKQTIYRQIPIFPYLKPIAEKIKAENIDLKANTGKMTMCFKELTGKTSTHTLKDLRHTFITRAKECGCNPELVATWAGHDFEGVKRGKVTSTVYTHFSKSYQETQAEMIRYYHEK